MHTHSPLYPGNVEQAATSPRLPHNDRLLPEGLKNCSSSFISSRKWCIMHYRLKPFHILLVLIVDLSIYVTIGSVPAIARWGYCPNTGLIITQAGSFHLSNNDTDSLKNVSPDPPQSPPKSEVKLANTHQLSAAAIPAFPGAEGYGALAAGGRGGRVIEVTNLNDVGPGSLRAAVTASGPRIIVFRIGGTIELQSDLVIKGENQAYLTIAGQTAPGGGILLKKYGLQIIDTHDIVVRYLRIRTGNAGAKEGLVIYGYEGFAHDIIIDHVSISWVTDDNLIWGNVWNVTIQWSMFAEGSRDIVDPVLYCGGCGFLWGPIDKVNHVSFHHNLLEHNYYRNPLVGGGEHEVINNVIYNPGWSATIMMGYPQYPPYPISIDFIGNYYKNGPDTRTSVAEISFDNHDGNNVSLYARDNFGWNYNLNDPYSMIQAKSYQKRLAPLASPPSVPVTIHDHEQAQNLVISKVGATLPRRDAVDVRLINEFNTTTGKLGIGSDFPVITNGTPPLDSDHDGIPDNWETLHGLNAANAADGDRDANGDGYTNIEAYLNELAGDKQSSLTFIANLNANPASGQAPLLVQFNGSASGGKTPYTFKWDFGDGNTSNVQNPAHAYQTANSFTAQLTVTDSENKQASTSRLITVTASTQDAPALSKVRLTEVAQTEEVLTITLDKWYDLYLYIDDPQGWNDISYAEVWLNHEFNNEGTISNRGGKYFAASNYVLSYSIESGQIWAKETEGTSTLSPISGRLGAYVDDDNNEYEQNSNEKWAKARIKLLAKAQTGKWTINAYVIDKEKNLSSLLQKSIVVSSATDQTAPFPPQNVRVSSGPP